MIINALCLQRGEHLTCRGARIPTAVSVALLSESFGNFYDVIVPNTHVAYLVHQ
jgi:hypothetical protein